MYSEHARATKRSQRGGRTLQYAFASPSAVAGAQVEGGVRGVFRVFRVFKVFRVF